MSTDADCEGRRETPSATIIVPAFNEQATIAEVLAGITALDGGYEIIVVDDGSDDETPRQAEQAEVTVISHDRRMGYGAALKAGVRHAAADVVLFFDADGQHDPADIPRVLDALADCDMAIGDRHSDGQGRRRGVGRGVFSLLGNYIAGTRIPDINSGLRAMSKDVLLKYLHLMPSGYSFTTTSTLAFLKSGRRAAYVPICVRGRAGRGRVGPKPSAFDALVLLLRLCVLFEPLKIFLPASFLLLLGSAAAFTIEAVNTGTLGISDATLLLATSAVLVFFFGLLTDQVSALRREKHE